MVRARPIGVPAGLLVAVALLALVMVHTVAYVAAYGTGAGFAAAMSAGGHEPYWTALVVLALSATVLAAVAARARTGFARRGPETGRMAGVRLVLRVWITLTLASIAGFVVLENLEGVAAGGGLVGLEPVALLGRLAALGPLAVGVTALALGAVAVVIVGRVEYAAVLNRSYAGLVAGGVYTADFRQSPWAVAFVEDVVGGILAEREPSSPLRVLECGCGTGVWLEELATITASARGRVSLFGFDLSPDMAEAARTRLTRAGVTAEVREGDILDDAAYAFDGDDRHDLVMAYDVVQQLPADVQRAAVDAMVGHLAPGGTLVVFDHDARSRFGRVMGTKKWLRRYLGLPLVPRYYIHSRYPDLEGIRRRVEGAGLSARIVVEAEGRKRALIVRSLAERPGGSGA